MFQTLLKFDISYANFFSNNNKIKDDEKPSYKLCVAQSLIRVAFSKEKKKFYQEKGNFYEYDLLKRIIDKDMYERIMYIGFVPIELSSDVARMLKNGVLVDDKDAKALRR